MCNACFVFIFFKKKLRKTLPSLRNIASVVENVLTYILTKIHANFQTLQTIAEYTYCNTAAPVQPGVISNRQ